LMMHLQMHCPKNQLTIGTAHRFRHDEACPRPLAVRSGFKPAFTLPCVHRSEEPIRCVLFECCGERKRPVYVFGCERFGECTPRSYANLGSNVHDCVACDARQELLPV
jgi:hypothetical protein